MTPSPPSLRDRYDPGHALHEPEPAAGALWYWLVKAATRWVAHHTLVVAEKPGAPA